MLDRDEPLFGLAPRREEHAAVVLEQPVGVVVPVVDLQELPVVVHDVGRERHATFGPDRHDMGRQAGTGDHVAERLIDPLAECTNPLVGLIGVATSSNMARAAATESGLPLKVPTML